jgi:hypothetical protein
MRMGTHSGRCDLDSTPSAISNFLSNLQLSAKRRVTVSEFKGSTFVNIREYYDADGEMRPGKKVSHGRDYRIRMLNGDLH